MEKKLDEKELEEEKQKIAKILEDKNIVHIKKINIFGDRKVGKSSLILKIDNYQNSNYEIRDDDDQENEKDQKDKIVEQIKKVYLKNEKAQKSYYLNFYETKISNLDFTKKFVDILLSYSECIIFMLDSTSVNSFDSIKDLITFIKDSNIKKNLPPLFLINNKIDINNGEVSKEDIKDFLDSYKDIKYFDISLDSNAGMKDFMNEFYEALEVEMKQDEEYIQSIRIIEPTDKISGMEFSSTINLMLLGSSGVGKTCFIHKFLYSKFLQNITSTIGFDKFSTLAYFNNEFIHIRFWDTSGQDRYRDLPTSLYRKVDGMLLLFDVTDKKSFQDVEGWIKSVREFKGLNEKDISKKANNEVLSLVGNKTDLLENRKISKEDAKKLASKFNLSYHETSCKDGINIYEIICKLIIDTFPYRKICKGKDIEDNKNGGDNIVLDPNNHNNNKIPEKGKRCCK